MNLLNLVEQIMCLHEEAVARVALVPRGGLLDALPADAVAVAGDAAGSSDEQSTEHVGGARAAPAECLPCDVC